MKNYLCARFYKQLLLITVGTVMFGAGMAMFYYCQLGADPVSVFIDGLHVWLGISYGRALDIFYIISFIVLFGGFKGKIRIGMVIALLLTGRAVDLFTVIYQLTIPQSDNFAARLIMLAAGLLLSGLGSGIVISAQLGCAPLESIILAICEKLNVPYRKVRICSDGAFLAVGWMIGGVVGLGTVCSLCIAGTFVELSMNFSKKYLYSILGLENLR